MSDLSSAPQPLWTPSAERIANSGLTRYQNWLSREHGLEFNDYESLWRWSTDKIEDFWASIWSFSGIISHQPYNKVLENRQMPGADWFPGARLNFAENMLARSQADDAATQPALIFQSEITRRRELSWHELSGSTGALMKSLRTLGVNPRDRVVSYMPNIPETLVAYMATAGVGAIWSSCSPDMGTRGVLDRFKQIAPTVMFAVDGYRYNGRDFDRRDVVREIASQLPSLRAIVFVPYLDAQASLDLPNDSNVKVHSWQQSTEQHCQPDYESVAFDHPLCIVYSSGTTGMPKPIVHGHGGSILESQKCNLLHLDVKRTDRFFWFSSTSWIMWNLWASTLATGCTAIHFDGNPGYPDLDTLWKLAEREKATFFGTSPAFIGLNMKAGSNPKKQFDLSALRSIGCTGAPLTSEAYQWVYDNIHDDVMLASISGGTDPGAAFLTSSPTLPVYSGEMQCRGLGCAVASYNDAGQAQIDEVGELVVTEPLPSMPLYFWGDEDGKRYFNSYFDTWSGVWRHGDWLRLTERPESMTSVIYGRSDSTINRHGIRMGTSELYGVIEGIDAVLDSLVIDLEYLGKPSQLIAFIVLRNPAEQVPAELTKEIQTSIRVQLSARHVPDQVIAIAEVPRTMSGKKLEVPVKRILLGHPVDKAVNRDSMANPQSIDWFIDFAQRKNH